MKRFWNAIARGALAVARFAKGNPDLIFTEAVAIATKNPQAIISTSATIAQKVVEDAKK